MRSKPEQQQRGGGGVSIIFAKKSLNDGVSGDIGLIIPRLQCITYLIATLNGQ